MISCGFRHIKCWLRKLLNLTHHCSCNFEVHLSIWWVSSQYLPERTCWRRLSLAGLRSLFSFRFRVGVYFVAMRLILTFLSSYCHSSHLCYLGPTTTYNRTSCHCSIRKSSCLPYFRADAKTGLKGTDITILAVLIKVTRVIHCKYDIVPFNACSCSYQIHLYHCKRKLYSTKTSTWWPLLHSSIAPLLGCNSGITYISSSTTVPGWTSVLIFDTLIFVLSLIRALKMRKYLLRCSAISCSPLIFRKGTALI